MECPAARVWGIGQNRTLSQIRAKEQVASTGVQDVTFSDRGAGWSRMKDENKLVG
jgi:hypothetical protein